MEIKLIFDYDKLFTHNQKDVLSDHNQAQKREKRRGLQILSSSANSAPNLCEFISSSYVFQKIINLPAIFLFDL
jgi:hypothetical protein